MNDVTRQDLIDWFGTENKLTDESIEELNKELNNARMAVFNEFGFQ